MCMKNPNAEDSETYSRRKTEGNRKFLEMTENNYGKLYKYRVTAISNDILDSIAAGIELRNMPIKTSCRKTDPGIYVFLKFVIIIT